MINDISCLKYMCLKYNIMLLWNSFSYALYENIYFSSNNVDSKQYMKMLWFEPYKKYKPYKKK